MKNKFIKEILIFSLSLISLFIFFKTSMTNSSPDTEVTIKLNDYQLEDREDNLIKDLNSITSISSVDISSDAEVIVLEVDNQTFDVDPVKKTLDKWEVDYEKEFGVSVIADIDEY
tara:strand:+ start:1221 stop:1565 length:345 start_codon:yes stop_codon:yes gene_type:complete